MDINQAIFTGIVGWSKEYRNPSQSWGSLAVRVDLKEFSFVYADKIEEISGPILWLNIKTNYEGIKPFAKDQQIMNACQDKKYILVRNAYVSHYLKEKKDATGNTIPNATKETIFKLDVSPSYVSFSDTPIKDINDVHVSGKVQEIQPNGWIVISSSYRAKKEFKERLVPLLVDTKKVSSLHVGQKIFVKGKVCCRTPSKGNRLYVYATTIINL
jgi:hypothetical protein